MDNICHFLSYEKENYSVHTVNFVYETKKQTKDMLRTQSVYTAYYVLKGTGNLYTAGRVEKLDAGDVFFTFTGTPFAIESVEDFEYMYISFIGIRANMLFGKMYISVSNCVFKNCSALEDIWKQGIKFSGEVVGIVAEGILLYTFSFIGNKTAKAGKNVEHNSVFLELKKYIDDNINEKSLSLKEISKALSYNEKYLSTLFKKNMGVGTKEYINDTRIQQACAMMEQGFTSISDISFACGFSDPLYFSKVFKSRRGCSPTDHINTIKKNNQSS